ncbi:tetratricopeptide repeat-containing sensor histidine kinase [Marinifilum sp. RC60d5]|uniref:tetratricopeptide repeat-containing sensor histidine kinase n=1 Tax=Marinifilum sp. RC60d5 TaxID=3458414 RepID=UPI0040371F28
MNKKPLILFILIYLSLVLPVKAEFQTSLDSLNKRFGITSGQEKLETLLEMSKVYWNIDPVESIELAKHALGTAQSLESEKEIAKAMYYLGVAYYVDNQLDNSLDYLLKAHRFSQTHNYKKQTADISRHLATVYFEADKLDKAYTHTIQALEIYNSQNDELGIAQSNNLLGLYYKQMGQYSKAVEYYENSLDLGRKISKKSLIGAILNDMGSMYAEIGDTIKAIRIYKEAVSYHKSNGPNFKSGAFELNLADLYVQNGKLKKAKIHLNQGGLIAKNLNSNRLLRDYYKVVSNFEIRSGNTNKAVQAFQKLQAYQDSISSWQLRNKIDELDLHHSMSISNQENELLRKQNQSQQLNFTRQYIVGLLILLVLLIVIFLLTIRYRNNLKDNELLYLKNSLVHQHQEELMDAVKRIKISEDKLRVANNTKDKMFSLIAHDLRGAIGNVSNGLRMYLSEEDLNLSESDKEEFLQALFNSSESAYELMENLLFWAKNQTSTLSANKQMVDASSIISSNVGLFNDLAKIKSINLFSSENPNVEVFVDWNMINTVLRNLISNAIKFTNKNGNIEVKSEVGQYFVKISVIDDGIGMMPEQIENIYEGKTTDGTAAEKGTGLGLMLCRDFLIKNQGKMMVESELDKGSVFSFIIPKRPMNHEKYLELVEKETVIS